MFIPDYMFDTVYDIPTELFKENGIKCLFLDIDNTLAPYECDVPTEKNLEWFEELKKLGIKFYFISNNDESRVEKYARGLGVSYVANAGKPLVGKYRKLIEQEQIDISECACIGDQIFTDVLAASLLGAKSILVLPINDLKTFFCRFKRFFEKPFVRKYKKRQAKSDISKAKILSFKSFKNESKGE